MFRCFVPLGLAALALLGVGGCGESDSPRGDGDRAGAENGTDRTPAGGNLEPLIVGVILPMSGETATYGDESWKGMRLAEQDVLKAGAPRPFQLILRDEKSQPAEAETQAKSLMELAGAHVLLGTVASSNTKKIGLAAREFEVPCITPASTNDQLTVDNPWLSRVCFKDSFQGGALADFAHKSGWKKAAVVVDNASDYARGLADQFKSRFEAAGGTTHFEYYKVGSADFSNVIQGVADYGPDVIFISGYYEQGGPMIQQAKARWAGKPVIGGDGLDSAKFMQLIGDAKNPIYFTTHFAPDAPDPRVQAFAKRYQDAYGEEPGAMAALGYDVLLVLMDAVKRCPDPTNPTALRDAIAATKGVQGITGTIGLDNPERTPIKDVVLVTVDGGKKKYHSTIHP